MEKIGLIAGNRKLPILFAEAAKKKGYYIAAVAIKGETSHRLKRYVDKVHWISLAQFSQLAEIFKGEAVTKVIMAGQISPRRLFSPEIYKSEEVKSLLRSIEDKRADTIFGAIAEKLNLWGFELLDSTTFIEDYLPGKGAFTKMEPDPAGWEDIYFGLNLAKAVASLDIGQTVAVKHKAIVAVEALEGTDNLIRRAGNITAGGITIVKVSKPKQDKRFDVPVVGLNTIKNLVKANISCLAIEAAKTIFIDKEPSIKLADRKGISIVAV